MLPYLHHRKHHLLLCECDVSNRFQANDLLFFNDTVHAVDTSYMTPDYLFIGEDECAIASLFVCWVHIRRKLLELLYKFITKTSSDSLTEKLSMYNLSWLDTSHCCDMVCVCLLVLVSRMGKETLFVECELVCVVILGVPQQFLQRADKEKCKFCVQTFQLHTEISVDTFWSGLVKYFNGSSRGRLTSINPCGLHV